MRRIEELDERLDDMWKRAIEERDALMISIRDHRDALHELVEAKNAEVSELREDLEKARAREDALQMVIDRWMGERTAHGAAGPSREGG
jgi:DNA repair exonuclease SbcCD ATPase subunit